MASLLGGGSPVEAPSEEIRDENMKGGCPEVWFREWG